MTNDLDLVAPSLKQSSPDGAGVSMNAMIEQAKAERLTLERLAMNVRRLNSVIRLTEIEAIPDRNQQLKELQKDICDIQIELDKLKRK